MKSGDTVNVRHIESDPPAKALVEGTGEGTILLRVESSEWLRKILRKQGIFIGEEAVWMLTLFKDHTGRWRDAGTMEAFLVDEVHE